MTLRFCQNIDLAFILIDNYTHADFLLGGGRFNLGYLFIFVENLNISPVKTPNKVKGFSISYLFKTKKNLVMK